MKSKNTFNLEEQLMSVTAILNEIEQELKELGRWGGQEKRPAGKAFESTVPFFLDTMEFHQWLEYVLVAKFRALISLNKPLPSGMLIHTAAQEVYRGSWQQNIKLIALLKSLDDEINRH